MTSKKRQTSQTVSKPKKTQKSAQDSFQVLTNNPILRVVEEMCGYLSRLEAGVRPGLSHPQEREPGGVELGGGMENADPVMSLLQVISSPLAAFEEEAGSSRQDSPMHGPSKAPSVVIVPYTFSPAADLAVPSSAHQPQPTGKFESLRVPIPPADVWGQESGKGTSRPNWLG